MRDALVANHVGHVQSLGNLNYENPFFLDLNGRGRQTCNWFAMAFEPFSDLGLQLLGLRAHDLTLIAHANQDWACIAPDVAPYADGNS